MPDEEVAWQKDCLPDAKVIVVDSQPQDTDLTIQPIEENPAIGSASQSLQAVSATGNPLSQKASADGAPCLQQWALTINQSFIIEDPLFPLEAPLAEWRTVLPLNCTVNRDLQKMWFETRALWFEYEGNSLLILPDCQQPLMVTTDIEPGADWPGFQPRAFEIMRHDPEPSRTFYSSNIGILTSYWQSLDPYLLFLTLLYGAVVKTLNDSGQTVYVYIDRDGRQQVISQEQLKLELSL